MKILHNDLDVEIEEWDDAGDYPSNAGSGPLSSYKYVSEIVGELLIEIESGDLDPDCDKEEQCQEFAAENADLPQGIRVTEWAWSYPEPNKIKFSVQNFDASCYQSTDDY